MRRWLILACGAMVCTMAGCYRVSEPVVSQAVLDLPAAEINLSRAAAENRNRYVLDQFEGSVNVWDDPHGITTAQELFGPGGSASLIIADGAMSAQLRAASIAVSQRAPMVVYSDDTRADIVVLMDRLGVRRVLLVGDIPLAHIGGDVEISRDPGTTRALGDITAFQFNSTVVGNVDDVIPAVAALSADAKTELKAAWEPLERAEEFKALALPAQSRRDGGMAPVMIATQATSVPAVANATAWGGQVWIMPTGDPRNSIQQMAMVAGLDKGPLVALGPEFGTASELSAHIDEGLRKLGTDVVGS